MTNGAVVVVDLVASVFIAVLGLGKEESEKRKTEDDGGEAKTQEESFRAERGPVKSVRHGEMTEVSTAQEGCEKIKQSSGIFRAKSVELL